VAGYEVDALFREERVIVELDGFAYHRDRVSFESDRERDAATLAARFETVRVTWERLTTGAEREAARLRAILAARRLS
jgi:very-short-patch-repair endonuclease